MHRVRMLIHFGVIPYIVFDGDHLPSKAATEVARAKRREESKKKGLELYRLKKPTQAHLELQKAVDVTPEMALQFIDELKKIGVRYVVAPYEADAQLAYLERQGIIQGILSEDSDLLVFGAKRLLTKLDQYGDCIEINRADFTACREISLVGWSDADFRRMAILSGCDYLANINRMGLKSAYRLVRKHKTIEKIIRMLSFDGQYHVPPGYLEAFYKAELTFLHQRVFCPLRKEVVMMTDLQADAQPEDFSFIGGMVEQKIAIGVAKGELDPMTKQPIRVYETAKAAPGTPWVNSRRNTVNAYPNTKSTKPIDSFFKQKRKPLADLDPNTFTPSPSQERLLREANGSMWESSSTPSGPPPLRPTASIHSFGSEPGFALEDSMPETFSSLAAAVTRPTPQKRRRLCNDPSNRVDAGDLVASGSERSRFFASNKSDPCSSMKKNRISRKGKSADITVWSDDSIEDVMAELPDVDCPQLSKKGKMEIFKDGTEERAENDGCPEKQDDKVLKEGAQSLIVARKTVKSEVSISRIATSFPSSALSVAANLDKHVTSELKILAQKYTNHLETERKALQGKEMESSKGFQAGFSASQAISKPPKERNMTPLERLGLSAMNRSRFCSSFFNNTTNSARMAEESALLSSSIPGLPMAYGIGPDASIAKGSEDTIISYSGDEGGSASEVEERTEPAIDLARFAFTG